MWSNTRSRLNRVSVVAAVPRRAQAFTLLELMLSMVLMVALLSATWMLLGVFRDRVEKAQTQTEQRHLTRSLQLTLASDLRNRYLVLPDDRQGIGDDRQHGVSPAARDQDTGDTGPTDQDTSSDDSTASGQREVAPIEPRSLFPASAESSDSSPAISADENNTERWADSLDAASAQMNSDPVANGEWKSSERFFLGTPQSVRFDVIPPAMPGRSVKPNEPPNLENAAIPDVVHRVVYVFSDPTMALVADQPSGLIRGEFTTHQLTDFGNAGGDTANLLTFLRPTLEKIAPDAFVSLADTDDQSLLSEGESVSLREESFDSRSNVQAEGLSRDSNLSGNDSAISEPPSDDPQGLLQHVDYAPEVAAFLLRYYDGSAWSTSWDSRQQHGQWPVAVELRFQLAHEVVTDSDPESSNPSREPPPAATAASRGTADGVSVLSANRGANPLEPQDDELRSAQTQPLNDHRYLIFVRASDRESTSPRSEEARSDSTDADEVIEPTRPIGRSEVSR